MTSENPNIQPPLDVEKIRADFPILHQEVKGKPLVYLDNAATTQKPKAVIHALTHYYETVNSNVHRGAHTLSDLATREFENARVTVQQYLNAPSSRQIIWTRGTTESLNLVAHSYAREFLKPGDEILISAMEHHSNIVPWQIVAQVTGAVLKIIPVQENGELDMAGFEQLLSDKTRFISIVHVSNSLGTINPVKQIIDKGHEVGAVVCVDGAQAAPHWPIDVQALDCDFYAFSGHKIFGPTGIGVLYGKEALLNKMVPYQSGGEMIEKVSFSGTTYNELPFKFEAGTPNIAGAIGLGAAIAYLNQLPRAAVEIHEAGLMSYAHEKARDFGGLRLIGTAKNKTCAFSFLLEGAHPHDVGTLLDQQGIAVRTGHHCTMPLMEQFGIPGTARASFSIYNTREEIDQFFAGLEKAKMLLL
ncbi:MAG: cysteine desulfurase [Ketobacteraceae bacterium]|nr:cysteine desulfurase [Ketobacteraceae bacterium]